MNTALLAVLVLVSLSPDAWAQQAFPTARIAFFSPERVTEESLIGQAGIARLEEFRAQTTREIQNLNRELEQARERLEQGMTVLRPEAVREQERTVENFEVDLQRFIEDAQAEFLGIQREVETDFLVKLGPVIEGVAQEKDVHFVFSWPSPALFFADQWYDLTGEIIEQLDEAYPAND